MGALRYNYHSPLVGNVDITVIIPSLNVTTRDTSIKPRNPSEAATKYNYKPGIKFQTIYFLHGGGDDDTVAYRYTSVERYAEENNIMLVTPRVQNGLFADSVWGDKHFTFCTEELPRVVESIFPAAPGRENTFLLGFAMGGNGALGMWLRRPDLYAACADLSGGIGFTVHQEEFFSQMTAGKGHVSNIFGSDTSIIPGSEYDMYGYAKKNLENKVEMPKFFLGVGGDEYIIKRVHQDRDVLTELGYHFTYKEYPGYGHDFAFWEESFKYLIFNWFEFKRRPLYPGEY